MSRESRLRQRVHDMGPRSKARWGMLLGTLAHTSSGKHMWVSSRRFASLGLLPHTEVCFEDPPHLDVDCTLTDDDEAVCAMIAQKLSLGGPRSRVRIRGADAARLARLADVASRQAGLFCRIIQPASGDAAEAVTGVGNADAGTRLPTDRLRRCFRLLRYDLPAPMAPLHLWERSRSAVTAEELAGAGSNGVDNTGAEAPPAAADASLPLPIPPLTQGTCACGWPRRCWPAWCCTAGPSSRVRCAPALWSSARGWPEWRASRLRRC